MCPHFYEEVERMMEPAFNRRQTSVVENPPFDRVVPVGLDAAS